MRVKELQEKSLAQFLGQKIKTAFGNQPNVALDKVGAASQTVWNDLVDRTSRSQVLRGQSPDISDTEYKKLLQSFVQKTMLRQQITGLPVDVQNKVNVAVDQIVRNRNNTSGAKSGFQELARASMTPRPQKQKPKTRPVQTTPVQQRPQQPTSVQPQTAKPQQQQSASQTPPVGAVIPKSSNLPAIKWTGDAWTSMDGIVKYANTPDTIARMNQAYFRAKKAGII